MLVEVNSVADLNKVLSSNQYCNFLLYDGEWSTSSSRDPFSYQYLCYSELYPRLNFYVVKRTAEVAAAILDKFGLEASAEKKSIAFRSTRRESTDSIVFFSFYHEKPAESLKAGELSAFHYAIDRCSSNGNATFQSKQTALARRSTML
ncbi:uncharacterized protein DFL_006481 [Arthrobotrys flagrans]|uniref:Uncharacterized protein n=1 Tax=Arthrobotrys flagrans TaxID=97331 RepID=A0A437A144_ARTFL|nr:hypothetical protein DFL_006481 [Arthrobotrys flagrans]